MFAKGNVILNGALIFSDAWGLVDVKSAAAEKQCYYFPEHLQIATIALNGFSFLVNIIRMFFGVSGTEPKSDDRVLESSLGHGGGRMPGQNTARPTRRRKATRTARAQRSAITRTRIATRRTLRERQTRTRTLHTLRVGNLLSGFR
jgi:hypothetical protein